MMIGIGHSAQSVFLSFYQGITLKVISLVPGIRLVYLILYDYMSLCLSTLGVFTTLPKYTFGSIPRTKYPKSLFSSCASLLAHAL